MDIPLILQFQAAPASRLALRVLGYLANLYEELQRIPEFEGGTVSE